MHAKDVLDIERFHSVRDVKLTDTDRDVYANFPIVVQKCWQQEILETVFEELSQFDAANLPPDLRKDVTVEPPPPRRGGLLRLFRRRPPPPPPPQQPGIVRLPQTPILNFGTLASQTEHESKPEDGAGVGAGVGLTYGGGALRRVSSQPPGEGPVPR